MHNVIIDVDRVIMPLVSFRYPQRVSISATSNRAGHPIPRHLQQCYHYYIGIPFLYGPFSLTSGKATVDTTIAYSFILDLTAVSAEFAAVQNTNPLPIEITTYCRLTSSNWLIACRIC